MLLHSSSLDCMQLTTNGTFLWIEVSTRRGWGSDVTYVTLSVRYLTIVGLGRGRVKDCKLVHELPRNVQQIVRTSSQRQWAGVHWWGLGYAGINNRLSQGLRQVSFQLHDLAMHLAWPGMGSAAIPLAQLLSAGSPSRFTVRESISVWTVWWENTSKDKQHTSYHIITSVTSLLMFSS